LNIYQNINSIPLYRWAIKAVKKTFFLGRKGIEPSTALAIEFTAQPIIPTNGTFLFYIGGGVVNVY
jgi:hypothetical protein